MGFDAEAGGHVGRQRLHAHSELRAGDLAGGPQRIHHVARHVRRNRKTDPDVAVRGRQDLRVDADQLALRVDERAAGVAVVDRRVGLQEVLEAAVAGAGGAALGADDARGDRLPDAKRVADGEHHVADTRLVRIGERKRVEPGGLHFQHREIARCIVAHDGGRQHAAIRELDLHLVGAVHHVVVGENVTVTVDDDARAEAFLARYAHAPAGAALVELAAEELTEPGIGKR